MTSVAKLNSMEAGEVGVFSDEPDGKIHHFYTRDDEGEFISSVRFHLAEMLGKLGPHSGSNCAAAWGQADLVQQLFRSGQGRKTAAVAAASCSWGSAGKALPVKAR